MAMRLAGIDIGIVCEQPAYSLLHRLLYTLQADTQPMLARLIRGGLALAIFGLHSSRTGIHPPSTTVAVYP